MPRTDLTKTTLKGPFVALPATADSLDATFAAADVANKNQFACSGNDILIAWNSGASPYTVTFTSVVDSQLRTGDITTYSLAAGDIMAFRFGNDGWRQTDGKVYVEASNASVKFAVLTL